MGRAGMDHPFWEVVEDLIGSGRAEHGTIMGGPCLRSNGEFVAMPLDPESRMGAAGAMVVKLDRDAVTALIAAGEAASFAPAGKVFGEWAQITHDDHARWRELVEQALARLGN